MLNPDLLILARRRLDASGPIGRPGLIESGAASALKIGVAGKPIASTDDPSIVRSAFVDAICTSSDLVSISCILTN